MFKLIAGIAGMTALMALSAPSHAATRPAVNVSESVRAAAFDSAPAAPQVLTVEYYYDSHHHRHYRRRRYHHR